MDEPLSLFPFPLSPYPGHITSPHSKATALLRSIGRGGQTLDLESCAAIADSPFDDEARSLRRASYAPLPQSFPSPHSASRNPHSEPQVIVVVSFRNEEDGENVNRSVACSLARSSPPARPPCNSPSFTLSVPIYSRLTDHAQASSAQTGRRAAMHT